MFVSIFMPGVKSLSYLNPMPYLLSPEKLLKVVLMLAEGQSGVISPQRTT